MGPVLARVLGSVYVHTVTACTYLYCKGSAIYCIGCCDIVHCICIMHIGTICKDWNNLQGLEMNTNIPFSAALEMISVIPMQVGVFW